jgi:nucleoside-diphosphate-sugar epimerase
LPGEVVNLATGELTSVRAFAETAATILGMAPERLRFGALPTRAEEMVHAPVAIGRLRELVNWHPRVGIEFGIRRTVEFRAMRAETGIDVEPARDLRRALGGDW